MCHEFFPMCHQIILGLIFVSQPHFKFSLYFFPNVWIKYLCFETYWVYEVHIWILIRGFSLGFLFLYNSVFGCHETFGYESTIKNGFPKRARMNKMLEIKKMQKRLGWGFFLLLFSFRRKGDGDGLNNGVWASHNIFLSRLNEESNRNHESKLSFCEVCSNSNQPLTGQNILMVKSLKKLSSKLFPNKTKIQAIKLFQAESSQISLNFVILKFATTIKLSNNNNNEFTFTANKISINFGPKK